MARINTNVSALIANTNLNKSQASLSQSIERLSSGLRINSGADDPSGLIASEGLKSEIQGLTTAIDNSTQATNVISTADAALGEVSNLLVSIKGLIVQAANTGAESSDQIAANQLQVDSAIQSITRIANTTNFGGLNLLDGSLGYITSGIAASALHDVQINNANFGTQKTIPVVVNVLQSAQTASLKFAASALTTAVTIQVQGSSGVQAVPLDAVATASQIIHAINLLSDSTGVTARLTSSTNLSSGVTFNSVGYGSSNFVSVTILGNSPNSNFVTTDKNGNVEQRASGQDVQATIDGTRANGNGLSVSLNTPSLSLSFNLDSKFGIGTEAFTITGGGANFQLGSKVQSNEQISIGISSVAATSLGDASDGYLSDLVTDGSASLANDPTAASKIIDTAINQVSDLRGRLGAFEQNTLQTNINSLQVALENVTSSESTITDVDFASETSNLTRNQILVQAGTSVLAQANSTPQAVLALLK